jgi:hypothetical protein
MRTCKATYRRHVVLILAILLAYVPLAGQNAVVAGRVVDSSGAVVPGAAVELTNRATGIRAATTANAEGYYVMPPQLPGVYDIVASATGFSATRLDGITLEVGQSRTVNLQLKPGDVKESITVSDTAPLLTTNRADRGTVVENQFVASIPLNLRNPLLLLTLAPGVTAGIRDAGINTASQSATNAFRINGGRSGTSEILLDGAANIATYNNQLAAIPQVDSVREFKVNTSPYAAEFGRTGGGVISFALKSGANSPHGTVHEFLRNSVLDANGFNSNRAGQGIRNFKRNQFGFTLGGPVWLPKVYNGRNRTFFFVAYEGLRESSFSSFLGTVPTDPERRGDFSRSLDATGRLIRVFDPRTTRLDPDRPAGTTRYIRDQFPGNAISASQLSPVAVNLLKYYPAPNQPGQGQSNTGNYFIAAGNSLNSDRVDLRVDHQISSKHLLFGHYDWFENLNAMPLVYGNFASPVESPNRIPGINWMVNHTWTLSPVSIFEHHFSVADSRVNRIPRHLGFDLTSLGLPKYIPDSQLAAQFPQASVSGLSGLGSTGTTYSAVVSTTTQYAAAFTRLRGRHTLKSGIDFRLYHTTMDRPSPVGISAGGSFTGGPNPQAASAPSGRGLADLLLGAAGVSVLIRPVWDYQHPYYAAYAQDEIKLTSRLAVTLGLRYSQEKPNSSVGDIMVFLDRFSVSPLAGRVPGYPDLRGGLGFAGVGGAGRRTQITDTDNFEPRIGLAWQLNGKTVVRSGFGMFRHPLVHNTDTSLGFERRNSSLTAEADGVTPLFNLGNPFPGGVPKPTGNSDGLLTFLGQGLSGAPRTQRLPYQSQWSLDVQRQLPWAWVIDVAYAGNAAVALPTGINYNQLPMDKLPLGTALNQLVANPFYGVITDATSTLSRAQVQRGQLLLPYPQFLSMYETQVPIGHSTYHALQVRLERRFAQGLAVLLAYTHSKTIDNVSEFSGSMGYATNANNNYCSSCDRSTSYQHTPDVLRLSYRYELPLGVGKPHLNHGVLARLIGGWAVAGFISADNGTPVVVSSPNDSNSFGGGEAMRPNATGQKARLDTQRQYVDGALYFNPAAFVRTPQFAFGNVSRALPDVRVPGDVNWDALIEKRFSVTERVALDFRTELFNATNHVIFAGPNTSVVSGDFGRIRLNQVNRPRQIQFGLRLNF